MANRQPRRSAQQWAQIVTEFRQSGMTAGQFCDERSLSRTTFNKWLYRKPTSTAATSANLVKLVPDNQLDNSPTGSLLIELDLDAGIQLRISR